MNLGEQIYRLRTRRNMSQGDLAEKLDVSRQSISKWENNGAVPELDKLIGLSELFGVTLDELVKGERAAEPTEGQPSRQTITVIQREPLPGRKIAGIILLCMGFLVFLLLTLLGGIEGILIGMIFGSPFFLCALNCFLFREYVGLYCGWAVYTAVDTYLRYATGLNWSVVLHTARWTYEMNYVRLVIGWVQFVAMVLLMVLTVLLKRKKPLELNRKKIGIFTATLLFGIFWWILWQVCYQPPSPFWWMWGKVFDLLRMVLITTALSWGVRRRYQKKKRKPYDQGSA